MPGSAEGFVVSFHVPQATPGPREAMKDFRWRLAPAMSTRKSLAAATRGVMSAVYEKHSARALRPHDQGPSAVKKRSVAAA